MKTKMLLISILTATLVAMPSSARADDDKDVKVNDKLSEANRKTHEKICQGNHGKVTAKDANSITIDGKRYALTADTRVNKQEEPILPKTTTVGEHVCYTMQRAADGSMQIAQLIAVPEGTEKLRVREKENDDSPGKVEVETPKKEIDLK